MTSSIKLGQSLKPNLESASSLNLDIYASKNTFPEVLLDQACLKLENMLGIRVNASIYYQTSNPSSSKPIGIT